ncbi:MAG TPA: STAS domain-containing protein [Blastocatellia bacterium]|nr:STAS domain-containing protein [Blastocatellia bacterium]
METKMEKMADITILELPGEKLIESNAHDFKQGVAPVLASNQKMVFDMSRLQFVDNSGLGALLSCVRKLHAGGGELKLFGLTNQVRGLINLVRMQRVFDIYNTREEACRSFMN